MSQAEKSKIHEFTIKVKFNKTCSPKVALNYVKESLKQIPQITVFGWDKSCPEEMEVVKISPKNITKNINNVKKIESLKNESMIDIEHNIVPLKLVNNA